MHWKNWGKNGFLIEFVHIVLLSLNIKEGRGFVVAFLYMILLGSMLLRKDMSAYQMGEVLANQTSLRG